MLSLGLGLGLNKKNKFAQNFPLDALSGDVLFAFSTKSKRFSSATNAFNIRRSSDNTEQVFGFSGDLVDSAGIDSFKGAGNAYVVDIYCQASGRTATEATALNQLEYISSGGINGNPRLNDSQPQGILGYYDFSSTFSLNIDFTMFFVGSLENIFAPYVASSGVNGIVIDGGNNFRIQESSVLVVSDSTTPNYNDSLVTIKVTGGSYYVYINGVLNTSGAYTPNFAANFNQLMRFMTDNADWNEFLVFNTGLSDTNRNLVEDEIIADYGL